MTLFDDLLGVRPFSLPDSEKTPRLKSAVQESFSHHFESCEPYRRFCEKQGYLGQVSNDFDYADLPYLPVGIFKRMRLASVEESEIVRDLRSSATTSQTPSTIIVDNVTRNRQMKTLLWLLSDCLGTKRLPFVVMDVDPTLATKGNQVITARMAATRGFLHASSSAEYCMVLNTHGEANLDIDKLAGQLEHLQSQNTPCVLLGYTYMVYAEAAKVLLEKGITFSLPHVTILHFGGWKTLRDQAVDKEEFNSTLQKAFGIPADKIIDAYGFTEQLGLIYTDFGSEPKRCPAASEIIIRDTQTLAPVPDGQEGLVEFITPLPHSYPGIAILLDDIGRIISREPSASGRHGTAFEILGRASEAELRGCGDVLAASMGR